jgi:hypothetical protein
MYPYLSNILPSILAWVEFFFKGSFLFFSQIVGITSFLLKCFEFVRYLKFNAMKIFKINIIDYFYSFSQVYKLNISPINISSI